MLYLKYHWRQNSSLEVFLYEQIGECHYNTNAFFNENVRYTLFSMFVKTPLNYIFEHSDYAHFFLHEKLSFIFHVFFGQTQLLEILHVMN